MSWLTSKESIDRYKEVLLRAASDDTAFNHFRREPGMREIVEGIADAAGIGYHAKLKDTDFFEQNWERISENDLVGNPRQILINDKAAAATTFRYAWNVLDMRQNGVQLDFVDVVEVGGGYGGLCRMVHAFHTPKSYTIVDLPEALPLAGRYLAEYGIKPRLVSCFEYGLEPIDTFISNYALTELTRDVQDGYVDKLMRRASSGYVTYNSQPHNVDNQYSLAQLQDAVNGISHIQQENVKKSECQVLIWKS